MDMQRLSTGMMERYEIDDRRPARINAVQFGMGEALLGTADRLIDDMNAALAPDARVGFACVQAGEAGYADRLNAQDGMYTLLVRGYEGEQAVHREQVVQCVLRAFGGDGVGALARDPAIAWGLVDDAPEARSLAARFRALRAAAGLPGIPLIWLGDRADGAEAPDGTAVADSLAFRAEPDEAARQCAEMNYLDEMLHVAEPYARLTLCGAPDALRERFPAGAAGIRFEEPGEAAASARLKAQVFDAGIFLMAAPGWLNGCDTLSDCMRSERLRRFVGEGFTQELLPALDDMDRQAVEQRVIESFERYENPLNRNRILRAAHHLAARFVAGPCRSIRHLAEARFEPPRRLSFALAATIMLYAGARRNPDTGAFEVARGKQSEALHEDEAVLARFAALSHDMDPESLAYAALADRELWGRDLREVDGLWERVALDIAAMQRQPDFLPDGD